MANLIFFFKYYSTNPWLLETLLAVNILINNATWSNLLNRILVQKFIIILIINNAQLQQNHQYLIYGFSGMILNDKTNTLTQRRYIYTQFSIRVYRKNYITILFKEKKLMFRFFKIMIKAFNGNVNP